MSDFPILSRKINGKRLVYLDNAATSQKPKQVVEAISNYYSFHNANVHRGIHTLGDESTRMYHESKQKIAGFIGATDPDELVLLRNTTEAINLVALSWGSHTISKDDVILVSEVEHHSNLVPWQVLANAKNAQLKFIPVTKSGEIDTNSLSSLMSEKVKLVSLVQISNFMGAINPVKELVKLVKSVNPNCVILVDGAQSVPHMRVNVAELGIDFLAFSGHKMLGPMGIGILWAKRALLDQMDPVLTGGGMISDVNFAETKYADLPDKFEAGTPDVASAVGLAAAVDYLQTLGMEGVRQHEIELTEYAIEKLTQINGLTIYGPQDAKKRGGVISFTLEGIHAHDVAQILDRDTGVAVRSGHHCVMPMHTKLNLPATTRVSFYVYNTKEEIDILTHGLEKVKKIFKMK